MPDRMEKLVIFGIIAYKGLLKYQIRFPLFKVSEACKFQMSSFWVSTGKTNSLKKAIFFSHATLNKKSSMFDTMAYQGLLKYPISIPLFKVSDP